MAHWEDLSMPEFEAAREESRTVILPVGSVEEHGPHLPLGTDAFHAIEVARRAAALRPVLVAPPVYYGICRSTREHPGTISLSGDTLRGLIRDLGREFYRQGLRRLIFISGHAGGTHMCALVEAGETLLDGVRRPAAGGGEYPGIAAGGAGGPAGPGKNQGRLPRRGGGDRHHAGGLSAAGQRHGTGGMAQLSEI